LTKLNSTIKHALKQQYPHSYQTYTLGSDAENAFDFQIKNHSNLPHPQRQCQLVPKRRFFFDFVWYKQRIVVEIDGGIWMRGKNGGAGAHSRPLNILRDMEKSNLAQKHGYRFFRFTPQQVKNGEALKFISELF